ncbi:MAG: hypothetical protein ACOCYR_06260 [Erythrobacter sp.]|uniref:hypothetical protein n=1 Tax=Erythrobacter sp. HL-111 TaxID=1798193 RepID=UPI0006DB755D|nr:hypothetical protein [Erythrobacter sp. HL-111]KPP91513.1 MAG: hypothetical protein HLUCCO15_08255 [Erythrobacteraceae bacterium HL-111]SDS23525.1 hypothetical protein SAMN04515621_1201 [Erythrobacter sp. HL-111]
MRTTFTLLLAAPLALAACGDDVPADKLEEVATEPTTPAILEEEAEVAEEPLGDVDPRAAGNVPSIAEVQAALAECDLDREVVTATCTANDEGTEYTCAYGLEGDMPNAMRETIIAAEGDTYTLIDIPEDCPVQ